MGVLTSPVAILTVRDADAFVGAAIRGCPDLRWIAGSDREELEAEGLAVLCELAAEYRPGPASFATFAARRLPNRLRDRWERLNPGMTCRARSSDGSRPRRRREMLSLNAQLESPLFDESRVRTLLQFERVPAAA